MGSLQFSSPPVCCLYCGISVGGKQRGFQYGDGRVICQNCHDTAIKTTDALSRVWTHTVSFCEQLGLHADWDKVPVSLENQPDMARLSGGSAAIGMARSQWQWWGYHSSEVVILYGMPTLLALETLAHEAGHVWCHSNGIRFNPADVEEGFCNVVAYQVLKALDARYHPDERIAAMLANPCPVYGGHFKNELARMQAMSWKGYLVGLQSGGVA
ncbi:MAG: protein DA1 [Gallionella sp.]|nr:protein DA1 [Gallionella sp.]